jgi:hypothetical protein
MAELRASRTLVKSGPELWAECSEAASLAKHLGEFGEIRITKLNPESTVAWEGDAVSGMVHLETAGWGTRVTLTVRDTREPGASEPPAPGVAPVVQAEPDPQRDPDPDPELSGGPEPDPVSVVAEPEPGPVSVTPEPEPEPEPVGVAPEPDPVSVAPEPRPVSVAPEPVSAQESEPAPRRGLFSRLFGAFRRPAAPELAELDEFVGPEPDPEPDLEHDLEPGRGPAPAAARDPGPRAVREPSADPEPSDRILDAALDSLGRAHHRPYSRS